MKAKTISIIRDFLQQKSITAFENFNNLNNSLIKKYGCAYNSSFVTPSEKIAYEIALREMNDYLDAINDFEKHNWN